MTSAAANNGVNTGIHSGLSPVDHDLHERA